MIIYNLWRLGKNLLKKDIIALKLKKINSQYFSEDLENKEI